MNITYKSIFDRARENVCTGGPRNSRTFYLQIRLFANGKNIPKFGIRSIFPRLFANCDKIRLKFQIKELIFGHTVLPHNSRFQYLR